MAGAGRTIYIAGAGIAGLTLALALAKFGATAVVLERNQQIQEVGAGLQISPNARRVLNQLGLDRAVAERAFEPAGIDVYPYRAEKPLVTMTLGRPFAERFGAPYAVMHRADLADVLYRACKRFANIDILFGVRSFDATTHPRGISVIIDEASGSARSTTGFALVGADGVHSRTRTELIGGPDAAYSGAVAWRTTLPMAALDGVVAADRVSVLFAPGYHAVCYPLHHRGQFNIALFAKVKAEEAFSENPPRAPKLPWSMLRSPQFDAIMAAAEGSWNFWPLSAVTTDTWHEGGIGLVGDAAHAMLPFQAQGAAMAIEDAAILAPLLMTEPNAESAFARYQALRRPRVDRVRKISQSNGFAFHMEWPFSIARNAVIRLQGDTGHFKRLAWLYDYDPAPEPSLPPAPGGARGTRSQ
ncbi:MAG TPA: FAD-dependent monooxygenase [Devosia sp.]|nr:FAD-dependent monooxygenase [Devosia sp.]